MIPLEQIDVFCCDRTVALLIALTLTTGKLGGNVELPVPDY